MTVRRRWIAAFCLIAGPALAGYARFFPAHPRTPASIARIGDPLPPLPVADASGAPLDAGTVSLGHKCVIAFYSASCHSCQVVLPDLQPFPPTLRLVLVNEEKIRSSENPWGLQGAVLFQDVNRVLSRSFPMSGTPTILFVDERGVLRDAMVGEHPRNLVQQKLRDFSRRP